MCDVVHGGKNQEQPRKENCESARVGESTSEPKSRERAQKRRDDDVRNGKRLDAAIRSAQIPVTSPGEDDAAKSRPGETRWMLTHFGNRQLLFLSHVSNFTEASVSVHLDLAVRRIGPVGVNIKRVPGVALVERQPKVAAKRNEPVEDAFIPNKPG